MNSKQYLIKINDDYTLINIELTFVIVNENIPSCESFYSFIIIISREKCVAIVLWTAKNVLKIDLTNFSCLFCYKMKGNALRGNCK